MHGTAATKCNNVDTMTITVLIHSELKCSVFAIRAIMYISREKGRYMQPNTTTFEILSSLNVTSTCFGPYGPTSGI
jgi:hypothetical protein